MRPKEIHTPTIREMLDDCNSAKTCSNVKFNNDDRVLIKSYTEQYDKKGFLSPKQIYALTKIWDKI